MIDERITYCIEHMEALFSAWSLFEHLRYPRVET
jgi:hypothetical protein